MKNIFFIRSDRFGEFLLSLYAIKLVKLNYPQSEIHLLAQKTNIELIKGVGFIDSYLEYDGNFCGFSGAWRLAKILKNLNVDCVVVLNPKKEFHLATFLAGVSLRVGYARKWDFCLNKKIKDRHFEADKHEIEYNLDLVSLICQEVTLPQLDFPVDPKGSLEFLRSSFDIDKKYIIIGPFTSHEPKKLELSFWSNLIKEMRSNLERDILLVGSHEEQEEALSFEKLLNVKNAAGKLTLRNLATILKYNCLAFVGIDSGPMHLASMLRVPVVGLFKASSSRRWGPHKTISLVVEGKDLYDAPSRIIPFLKKTDNLINPAPPKV